MFDKLLIANRGEIACRVMRTAHRLDLRTVAVYSDADRDALHVATADEAWRLGPAPASQSYLDIERVIAVATAAGADAVHPGYGFLSENPAFAEACAAAGIVFIGPPAEAIRAMGLKDAAKRLMEDAGVPVVPGYHGEAQHDGVLLDEARRIGFPVLVKAVAGGGGKGMRLAGVEAGLEEALQGARREARSSFGDDRVLIERCIARPRHIEVQVFADAHGNAVHLFERDCSMQRRHQKVVEEAPAPDMPAAMRAAMGKAAVTAAQAIGYRGAGTVEFIADASEGLRADRFWFMEMNTRLQVEHPVTEMVTGADLVEWQLRIAAGESLPVEQAELSMAGHAVEARVYAEDPARGFLPSTGTVAHLAAPPQSAHLRIELGVREGGAITPHYDPMIAKVIAHGEHRAAALRRLAGALRAFEVAGITTNLPFLSRLVAHPDFQAGGIDTGLIDRALGTLIEREPVPDPVLAIAAMHAAGALHTSASDDAQLMGARVSRLLERGAVHTSAFDGLRPLGARASRPLEHDAVGTSASNDPRDSSSGPAFTNEPQRPVGSQGRSRRAWHDPWSRLLGWQLWGDARQSVHHAIDGESVEATLTFPEDSGGCRIELGDSVLVAKLIRRDRTRVVLDLSDRIFSARIVPADDALHVLCEGRTYTVTLPARVAEDGDTVSALAHVIAPLPGKIAKVAVRSGERVERGAVLVVLEAMKMELSVDAPRNGVIGEVMVSEDDRVIEGAVLVTFAQANE